MTVHCFASLEKRKLPDQADPIFTTFVLQLSAQIFQTQTRQMAPHTFTGSVQLCFSVEQHVCALFSLELLLYVRLPDGGHCGVVQIKPVPTLLANRKRGRGKQ